MDQKIAECIPIFIGGEGRSGTTLMRVILDSHPSIACGPETHLFRDPKFEEFFNYSLETWGDRIAKYSYNPENYLATCCEKMIRRFFEQYAKRKNKKRWADKTPYNIKAINFFKKIFHEMKFIHVIRDGRDVTASLLRMPWGPADTKSAITGWKDIIESSKVHRGEDYYMEVFYEDLINNFEVTIRKVMDFVGEPYVEDLTQFYKLEHDLGGESSSKQVINPITPTYIGKWKNDLSDEDKKIIDEIAGNTLRELGYN